jgi:hypothetical protein
LFNKVVADFINGDSDSENKLVRSAVVTWILNAVVCLPTVEFIATTISPPAKLKFYRDTVKILEILVTKEMESIDVIFRSCVSFGTLLISKDRHELRDDQKLECSNASGGERFLEVIKRLRSVLVSLESQWSAKLAEKSGAFSETLACFEDFLK